MNTKLKRLLKKINYFRASRFYDRGWAELGKMISANGGFRGKLIKTDTEAARFCRPMREACKLDLQRLPRKWYVPRNTVTR